MSDISKVTNSPITHPIKAINKITDREKSVSSSKHLPKRVIEHNKDRRKLADRRKKSSLGKKLFELRSGHDRRVAEGGSGIDVSI
jgi:hypothetical protein